MPDDFEPRENDHLVEPIFEALREPSDDRAAQARGGRAPRWALVLLVAAVAGSLIWALRGCGARGAR